ncbi:SCND3 protein, partial [Atractosteus spatula]|nr:SCND3 protein [Atractosteus spatula]
MKSAHLRWHFTTKHALLKEKPVDFFQRKLKDLKQRKSTIRNSVTPVSKAQEASYHASLWITNAGKPHTIGEELGLPLAKELGVCTDSARAMTDRHSGVVAQITEFAPDIKWTHCSIILKAFAAKKMPEDLKSVLDSSVKVPMNSRLFSVLCNEMGSEHVQLLLHNEVRWLSSGKVLTRLFEVHSDVQMFLHDQQSPLATLFDELNMRLQGLSLAIFDVSDKITVMKQKLQLFVNKIKASYVSDFPTLENYLHTYGVALDGAVCDVISVHLFLEYFPVEATPEWIRNPFIVDVIGIPKDLICAEQEKLLELSSDATLMSEDYQTGRPKFVRLQNCVSAQVMSNTEPAQGTVLSPFLFTIYMSEFKYNSGGQEEEYRGLNNNFVKWCGDNHLQLNMTKELVVDFRSKRVQPTPVDSHENIGTAWDRKVLQRVVKSAQLNTGCELPNIQDIYSARCLKKSRSILKDPSHPSHKLFSLLPSGKWY